MSLSVFVSPNTKTGTSTIANYVALNIAKKTKELVLLIEFSRYTGRSIYMQRQVAEKRRSLKNVVLNPSDFTVLQENIMLSKNDSNLYFLSMNLYEDFLEMKTYTSTSLTRLISNAKNYFQHIVIDLPSNFEEPVTGATFSDTFDHKIDNIFMVLDEDALTYKLLYDFSSVLRLGNVQPLYVTYIVNKITKHYIDFIENHLTIPLVRPLNLVKLLWIPEMVDCCNSGSMLHIGLSGSAGNFLKNIGQITDIALSGQKGTKPITGVGIKSSKKERNIKEGMANEPLTATKGGKKRFKKEKPAMKPKKNKQSRDNSIVDAPDDLIEENIDFTTGGQQFEQPEFEFEDIGNIQPQSPSPYPSQPAQAQQYRQPRQTGKAEGQGEFDSNKPAKSLVKGLFSKKDKTQPQQPQPQQPQYQSISNMEQSYNQPQGTTRGTAQRPANNPAQSTTSTAAFFKEDELVYDNFDSANQTANNTAGYFEEENYDTNINSTPSPAQQDEGLDMDFDEDFEIESFVSGGEA